MITLIRIIILAISAIFVLSWLYPAYWNWAVMPVEIIFPSNIVLLALAVILAIIPRLGRILLDLLSNAWEAALPKMASMPGIIKLSLWVIIPAVFFYLIRSQSLILGDGELILGRIVEGELISSTAFGYSQLVSLLAELFRIENLDQAANLMAALSIICGVVYTYFLYKTASLLVEDFRMRLWLFLIVLFSGLSVIFAGYVETYPILIAWLVIYFHSVVESMKYKSSVFIPAGILVVGLFWHIWFLAFLPSILWLINHRYKLIPNFVTFIISVLYIVAIYIAGTFISRSGIQTTLPLLPDETTNYFLFSPTHLIDFANVLIIAGPVLALLALAFLFYPAVYKKSHYLRFLLWAAVPAFLVSFMIDPVLGAPRDWDLLSIYSLPLFLFAALFIAEKGKSASKIYSLIIPILILNLIQFSSFAAMNMQSAKSLDRITRLAHADPHYQIDYYEGRRIRIFAHLLSYVYKRHQASVEFMEKMADAGQLDCLSGVSIANGYINMEEYETARVYYDMFADHCWLSNLDRIGYSKSLYMTRHFDEAIEQLRLLIQDTTAVPVNTYLGHSYLYQNQTDSGLKYLDKAVGLSEDSIKLMESLVDVLASDKRYEPALYFQGRLLQINPNSETYQRRYARLMALRRQ